LESAKVGLCLGHKLAFLALHGGCMTDEV
jgi:hypothetical protein